MFNLILSLFLSLLFSLGNFSCSKTTGNMKDTSITSGGFAIYFYNHSEASKYKTHIYEYDSSWMNFLNNAALSEVKITDENIDWYDWDNQQVRLMADGKDIFMNFAEKKDTSKPEYRSWEKLFIVTLNGKRLYAGRIELRFSQMGIRYPIISYGENGDNYPKNFDDKPILWLIPYLSPPPKGDPNEGGRLTVNNEEIYNYFKNTGKLK
jgi:hypothetical protein